MLAAVSELDVLVFTHALTLVRAPSVSWRVDAQVMRGIAPLLVVVSVVTRAESATVAHTLTLYVAVVAVLTLTQTLGITVSTSSCCAVDTRQHLKPLDALLLATHDLWHSVSHFGQLKSEATSKAKSKSNSACGAIEKAVNCDEQ